VIGKGLIGGVVVALVALVARMLAYAAEPGPSARVLERQAGGPSLPVLALASLMLGAAVAIAICWLVALAVRERALIERRNAEPFAGGRALALAVGLWVTASVTGALLEAFIHWRAGLGWHGLHCLVGPFHRDLLPIELGLSLVAAALLVAARHVALWMRRTFARLRAVLPRLWSSGGVRLHVSPRLRPALCVRLASARAPPALG
jgi:hypothetical protein